MVKADHITTDQVTLGKTRTRGHMELSQAWSDLLPSARTLFLQVSQPPLIPAGNNRQYRSLWRALQIQAISCLMGFL